MESRDVRSEIADPRCTKQYTIILIFTTDIPSVSRRIFFNCLFREKQLHRPPTAHHYMSNQRGLWDGLATYAVILGCQMRT